jgi:hypothetical protein
MSSRKRNQATETGQKTTTPGKGLNFIFRAVLLCGMAFALTFLLIFFLENAGREDNRPYAKLVGKWQRRGEEYFLDIRSVGPDGKMDVEYFNPDPIKVARGEASRNEGQLKVFVELRDANYPGCTYTLVYDPEKDQLAGRYFQALLKEEHEVEFVRR